VHIAPVQVHAKVSMHTREGRADVIEIEDGQWLDQAEVCELLGISAATWRATRRRGRGPQDGLVRLGKRVYVSRRSLRDWLDDCGESTDLTPAPRPPATAEVTAPARPRGVAVAPAEPSYSRGYRPSTSASERLYAGIGEPVAGRFQ
jgi:Helix-turn-helix domain